jgi:hypothetical protein
MLALETSQSPMSRPASNYKTKLRARWEEPTANADGFPRMGRVTLFTTSGFKKPICVLNRSWEITSDATARASAWKRGIRLVMPAPAAPPPNDALQRTHVRKPQTKPRTGARQSVLEVHTPGVLQSLDAPLHVRHGFRPGFFWASFFWARNNTS